MARAAGTGELCLSVVRVGFWPVRAAVSTGRTACWCSLPQSDLYPPNNDVWADPLGVVVVDYDIVTGVSVGAVNGAYFSQFPMGQQQAAAKGLNDLWQSLSTNKVYTSWCCGGCCNGCCTGCCGGVCDYACGLCHKGIYDTAPLRELIAPLNQASVRASGRILRIGVVAVKGAEYSNFDFPLADPQKEVDLHQAVMASAAFPLAFSPEQIGSEWYMDGGVRHINPIQAAIDAGATGTRVLLQDCARSEDLGWRRM